MGESVSITAVTDIVTVIWTQMGTLVSQIIANPVLLFPIAFVFAGSVVGIAKSLLGIRRKRRG